MTKHGWFSDEDLRGVHHRWISDRNGHRLLQFPYTMTVMGEPMYRDVPEHVIALRAEGIDFPVDLIDWREEETGVG